MNIDRPIYINSDIDISLKDPNSTHRIILNLCQDNADVLELGCATGYMTKILVERCGCRVTGFEINADAGAAARGYLEQLIIGDLENSSDISRIKGQFDIILMADVIEHLAWPETLLRAMHERLRPHGRLLISVPNVAHWSVRRSLMLGKWDLTDRGLMDRTHLRWYTRRTMTSLIESTGFRVIDRRASYGFPAHWRLRLLRRLAEWCQRKRMPAIFDDLFAIQHIFVARLG